MGLYDIHIVVSRIYQNYLQIAFLFEKVFINLLIIGILSSSFDIKHYNTHSKI